MPTETSAPDGAAAAIATTVPDQTTTLEGTVAAGGASGPLDQTSTLDPTSTPARATTLKGTVAAGGASGPLDEAQERVAAEVEESWLELALATGPADRSVAEAGVVTAYRAAGLPPPERIVWLGSPFAAAVAAALVTDPAAADRLATSPSMVDGRSSTVDGSPSTMDGAGSSIMDGSSSAPDRDRATRDGTASDGRSGDETASNRTSADGTASDETRDEETTSNATGGDENTTARTGTDRDRASGDGASSSRTDRDRASGDRTASHGASGGGMAGGRGAWRPADAVGLAAFVRDELARQGWSLGADPGRCVRAEVRTRPWAAARAGALAALGAAGWAQLSAAAGQRVWRLVMGPIARPLRWGVGEDLLDIGAPWATAARSRLLDAVYGQHDAAWLATFAAARRLGWDAGSPPNPPRGNDRNDRAGGDKRGHPAHGDDHDDAMGGNDHNDPAHGSDRDHPAHGNDRNDPAGGDDHGGVVDGPGGALAGLAAVAGAAGWWWPFERIAILSERPTVVERDNVGRLHRGEGPALAYPDGYGLYAWRGMRIPADLVDELPRLTFRRIQEERNAEVRRVMLEHFGYERYLRDAGARRLGEDETGVLWRVELPDDEPLVMVEVVNATPEPDGTRRRYWLRVPPGTRTAREGVAWTFGVSPEEYRPLVQT